ncbi:MAG: hypothetical protein IJK98_07420 [Clostridia bacterium]|nr:hypothetical protein [Clostridia bacterium]
MEQINKIQRSQNHILTKTTDKINCFFRKMHFRAGQGTDDSPPRFAPPFVVFQSQYNSRKNKINSAGTKVGFEGTKLRDGAYDNRAVKEMALSLPGGNTV